VATRKHLFFHVVDEFNRQPKPNTGPLDLLEAIGHAILRRLQAELSVSGINIPAVCLQFNDQATCKKCMKTSRLSCTSNAESEKPLAVSSAARLL
jgi:hypothetical protein